MVNQPDFVAFTSANFAYFPKVAVLARSFKQNNPNAKFVFLLNERRNASAVEKLDCTFIDEIVYPDDLNIVNEIDSWYFSHNVVEFCTATKPFALRRLLEKYQVPVMYLDPDIRVYSSLSELAEFGDSSVKLTPHMLAPAINAEEVVHHEISCLKHGVFNLGFLSVKPSKEGVAFASWWADRLREYCFADFEQGIFTDQRWVDLGATLFPFIEVIRNEGCNVASWNVSRRQLSRRGDQIFINESTPLRFFHFSGFDSKTHHRIVDLYSSDNETLQKLTKDYELELGEFEKGQWAREAWTYGTYENGVRIQDAHRRYFRKVLNSTGVKAPFSVEAATFFARRTSHLAKAELWASFKNYLKIEWPKLFQFLAATNGFRRNLMSSVRSSTAV